MARLEKRAREQEQFNKSGNLQIRGRAKQDDGRRDEPRKASKLSFGKSIAEAGRRFGAEESKQQPSLLSRIGIVGEDTVGTSTREIEIDTMRILLNCTIDFGGLNFTFTTKYAQPNLSHSGHRRARICVSA
jgi:hypothetical protein